MANEQQGKLTRRRFYKAEQEASFEEAHAHDTAQTQHPAYRLAFRDTDFLLRDELRPVRFQLELLKTEMLLEEANIGSTLVMYGSARIPSPEDAKNPKDWLGDALYQPESRDSFSRLKSLGFTEAVRAATDAASTYTFWDYQAGAWQKNNGIRIDHLLLSPEAADRFEGVGIDEHVRAWEKPSDHVPVWVSLRE